jgi:uncharacterized protein
MNSPRRLLCLGLALSSAACLPASWGAAAITRPFRLPLVSPALPAHRELVVTSDDVTLKGWYFEPTRQPPRGLVVYLHGKDNTRHVGGLIAQRFLDLGFAVVAFDQRAHGQSSGTFCTYGVRERKDLARVLDAVKVEPVFLIGHSLGAAVSLQAAAEDPRIRGVVALSSFSELDTIVREHIPFFASQAQISAALSRAEQDADFRISEASPVNACRRLTVPVLLVHGTQDTFTSYEHSRRLLAALPSNLPKLLLRIDGAGHEDIVTYPSVWEHIGAWVDQTATAGVSASGSP